MTRTIQFAVLFDDLLFAGVGDFAVRDGDTGVSGFHVEFHVAKTQFLAGNEPGFGHGFTIEKSAVGGPAVMQVYTVRRQRQFAVQRRHGGVVDAEFALRVATHAVHAQAQFNRLHSKTFSSEY